jgi:hypothetical protein
MWLWQRKVGFIGICYREGGMANQQPLEARIHGSASVSRLSPLFLCLELCGVTGGVINYESR